MAPVEKRKPFDSLFDSVARECRQIRDQNCSGGNGFSQIVGPDFFRSVSSNEKKNHTRTI